MDKSQEISSTETAETSSAPGTQPVPGGSALSPLAAAATQLRDGDARAPSRAAHALQHWLVPIGEDVRRDRLLQLARVGVDVFKIERMLDDELVPEDDEAGLIAHATEGEVLPKDWDTVPGPRWADAPLEHAA